MSKPVHFPTLFAAALAAATITTQAATPFNASARLASKADAWVLQQFAKTSTVPVLVQLPVPGRGQMLVCHCWQVVVLRALRWQVR